MCLHINVILCLDIRAENKLKTHSKIISALTSWCSVCSWGKDEVLEVHVALSISLNAQDFQAGRGRVVSEKTQAEANRNKMSCFSGANTS